MNAIKAVKEMYNIEELKEIADHGCQSGVCSQHIYYADTKAFFGDYEDDIMDYFESNYGTEFLVEQFKNAEANLDIYMNSMCWAFIESVAFVAVEEEDERIALEDAKIAEYMQPQPKDTYMYHTSSDGELVYNSLPLETTEELGNKIMAMGL